MQRPQLAGALLRAARDAMRGLGGRAPRRTMPEGRPEPLYIQVVQSYGRQAGSRSSHLNLELYAIPQVPHWVAEEIGGGARQMIKHRRCVWCAPGRGRGGERRAARARRPSRRRLRAGRQPLAHSR